MISSEKSGFLRDLSEFVDAFGGVYERSPWVAERAWSAAEQSGDANGVAVAMSKAVEDAGKEAQLALLRAHPDLGQRLGVRGEMTEESVSEQAGAGLNACSPEEYEAFQKLNARYRQKFGFPFILAVRGYDRAGILEQFRQRVDDDSATEFRTALDQVHRIARLRIEDIFGKDS